MNFITYITENNSFDFVEITEAEHVNFITTESIPQRFLVTAVYIDGEKRQIANVSPYQIAVVNDNNFDGDFIDISKFNQSGYFGFDVLPKQSSSVDLSVLIPYLQPEPYLKIYDIPTPLLQLEDASYNPYVLGATFIYNYQQDNYYWDCTAMDSFSNFSKSQKALIYYPTVFKYGYETVIRFADINIMLMCPSLSEIPLINGKNILYVFFRYNIRTKEVHIYYNEMQNDERKYFSLAELQPWDGGFRIYSNILAINVFNPKKDYIAI